MPFSPHLSPVLVLLTGATDLLDRLGRRFASFVFLLSHDTTGVSERHGLFPFLLLGWLLAGLGAAPIVHLAARLTGSSAELRKSLGVGFVVALIQVMLFALHWTVIAWGRRALDWSVFGLALIPAAFVVKWGHEGGIARAALLAILQAALSLLLLFLGAFTASELGWLDF